MSAILEFAFGRRLNCIDMLTIGMATIAQRDGAGWKVILGTLVVGLSISAIGECFNNHPVMDIKGDE